MSQRYLLRAMGHGWCPVHTELSSDHSTRPQRSSPQLFPSVSNHTSWVTHCNFQIDYSSKHISTISACLPCCIQILFPTGGWGGTSWSRSFWPRPFCPSRRGTGTPGTDQRSSFPCSGAFSSSNSRTHWRARSLGARGKPSTFVYRAEWLVEPSLARNLSLFLPLALSRNLAPAVHVPAWPHDYVRINKATKSWERHKFHEKMLSTTFLQMTFGNGTSR